MNLEDLVQGDSILEEQIEYLFSSFQKEYENTKFDERESIVGIGQPNRHLFCYFKREEENVFVKFKGEEELLSLPHDKTKLSVYIQKVCQLFRENDFITRFKKPTNKTNVRKPRIKRKIYFLQLNFCENATKLVQEYLLQKLNFDLILKDLRALLCDFINQEIINEAERNILFEAIKDKKERLSWEKLSEVYGTSSNQLRNHFRKLIRYISKQIDLDNEEHKTMYDARKDFMQCFSMHYVDTFLLYLKKQGLDNLIYAFLKIFVPKIYRRKQLSNKVDNAKKILSFIKSKSTTIKYQQFDVLVGKDGQVFTDLELLNKLNKAREELAFRYGISTKSIYKDKQLVIFATIKPENKDLYYALIGNCRGWDTFGNYMVNIINNYNFEKLGK